MIKDLEKFKSNLLPLLKVLKSVDFDQLSDEELVTLGGFLSELDKISQAILSEVKVEIRNRFLVEKETKIVEGQLGYFIELRKPPLRYDLKKGTDSIALYKNLGQRAFSYFKMKLIPYSNILERIKEVSSQEERNKLYSNLEQRNDPIRVSFKKDD